MSLLQPNKIAIVVQRYGTEVNGGAEAHARLLVEQLHKDFKVEVLTTTALSYRTWENFYRPGVSEVNGVEVRRFKCDPIDKKKQKNARNLLLHKAWYHKVIKATGTKFLFSNLFRPHTSDEISEDWITHQGPNCPELVDYIRENQAQYDVFIFFTYLYYPTVKGMPLVGNKSVFIPTAHDEKIMFTYPYRDIFSIPKAILFNTPAERRLVESHFKLGESYRNIAGIWLESNPQHCEVNIEKYNLNKPYFIYVGRIDKFKGCKRMYRYFKSFHKRNPGFDLVMVGNNYSNLKPLPYVKFLGFVEEEDKFALIQNSLGLIIPSKHESLSLVTLEAMTIGKPVLANVDCEVLAEHIARSQAGFTFRNREEFILQLEKMKNLSSDEIQQIAENGQRYVAENYSENSIKKVFQEAFEFILKSN